MAALNYSELLTRLTAALADPACPAPIKSEVSTMIANLAMLDDPSATTGFREWALGQATLEEIAVNLKEARANPGPELSQVIEDLKRGSQP